MFTASIYPPGAARAACLLLLTLAPASWPAAAAGASTAPGPERLRALVREKVVPSLDLLREMLAVPNDAHFPEQVEANARWVETAFRERGFGVRRLETGGPPLVLAERRTAGEAPTVLVYLQIDGQPVDPARWAQDDPFAAVLKEPRDGAWQTLSWDRARDVDALDPDWRLFARSAADAKGPVVAFLTALDALDGAGLVAPYHLKVIMDLEEELGSPHLPAAVDAHREALAADALLILDGPPHASNRPTLVFGARGIATVTLTVFGPRAPQHSGHYGNWVPNPAMRLARLLASMKDADGRVTIAGFYDGVVLDGARRQRLAAVPDDEEAMRRRIGIAAPDRVGDTYRESLQYPSLNVRGLASAWVGEQARTLVPATATAEIDIRLVPESSGERLVGLVRRHIEEQGYRVLDGRQPTEAERLEEPRLASVAAKVSYAAFQTPVESPVGDWLARALRRAHGADPVRLPRLGGSIPVSPFVDTLGIPAVLVPSVNPDNNQHAPDENLRLGNYIDGIRQYLAILTEPLPAAAAGSR